MLKEFNTAFKEAELCMTQWSLDCWTNYWTWLDFVLPCWLAISSLHYYFIPHVHLQ